MSYKLSGTDHDTLTSLVITQKAVEAVAFVEVLVEKAVSPAQKSSEGPAVKEVAKKPVK